MKVAKKAFLQFCKDFDHEGLNLSQTLSKDKTITDQFFWYLRENSSSFDFVAMIPELLRLASNNQKPSIDLALAKLIGRVFPMASEKNLIRKVAECSSDLFQGEQKDAPLLDRILGNLPTKLLANRPKVLEGLGNCLSAGQAYLLYLEADQELPSQIEKRLDPDVKRIVEAAHKYNQNPLQITSMQIEGIPLKDIAPYLRYLEIYGTNIVSLPEEMLNLRELNCSGCENLTSLPKEMPNLTKLNCSSCIKLLFLPEKILNLTCLNCRDCHDLLFLPLVMSNLLKLDCMNCMNLKSFALRVNKLKFLNCRNCQELTFLPKKMPNLIRLDCSFCEKLASLAQEISQLEYLNCDHCHSLAFLPENTIYLEELTCEACRCISFIPETMSHLHSLNCKDCLLTDLPLEMPLLSDLNCSGCINLQGLPQNMFSLEFLNCRRCRGLVTFPRGMSNIRELCCTNCCNLVSLPQNMMSLELLDCRHCIALRSLPHGLPDSLELYCQGCSHLTLLVDIDILNADPQKILLDLQKKISICEGRFPVICLFETNVDQSEGIDAGGISRDFLNTWMQKLIESKNSPLFPILGRYRYIPRYVNDEQAPYFQALGEVFAAIYQSNAELLLGPVFDIAFFRAMTSLKPSDFRFPISSRAFIKMYCAFQSPFFDSNPLASGIYKILNGALNGLDQAISLTEKELETLHYVLFFNENESLLKEAPVKLTLEDLKSYGVNKLVKKVYSKMWDSDENHVLKEQIEAVFWISYAMFQKMPEAWEHLCLQGADALGIHLQGFLRDYEDVWNKMSCEVASSVLFHDAKNVRKFFKTWLKKASLQQLMLLVKFWTGSLTVTDATKFNLFLFSTNKLDTLPVAHTCSNILQLPASYETQEIFNKKLELALKEGLAGTGFQFD